MQSKGTRISSRKQDDFVGFRSIRSSTSGRWLEKSGKHVGPNFTLKPNTKARSLHFCKTEKKKQILVAKKREISDEYMAYLSTKETSAPLHTALHKTGQVESGWKIHSRGSFIHVSVILYISMYVCIYNFLWMILIPSLWSELLEVRWQSLAKISWFLCHCEIIKNNFIKIRSCSVWILWLANCLVSFRALSQRALGKKVV